MPHSILTPTQITREALRVLHSELSFIGNVNRAYDNSFAQSGAKIGQTLNVRMPSKYSVRTNATYAGQDHIERSTPLTVSSQYGVDVSFSSLDWTMSLDDISKRVLKPAMAQLAAKIESDALAVAMKSVANYVGTTSTQMSYKSFQQQGQVLTENLGPRADRAALLNPLSKVEFLDAVKGLFNDPGTLSEAYVEGKLGRTGGFTVFENTLIPSHTIGSLAGTPLTTGTFGSSVTTNAWVSQTAIDLDGATSGTTIKAGDVLTFGTLAAGLVDVHPESKVSLGKLKKFVATADVTVLTAGTATVTVVPGVIYGVGNAFQNCSRTKADTDNMTVTNWGAASTAVGQNLAFCKDAFVFTSCDLADVGPYGAKCARENMDGISMRWAQQYSVSSDAIVGRFDVLWGFAPLYPELAVRHIHTLA